MYIRWNYIDEKMKFKKITNTKMAELLDVNRDTWNKWKSEKTDITLKKFIELLQILDLTFDDVVRNTKLTEFKASNDIYIPESPSLKEKIEQLINETENKPKLTVKLKRIEKD